VVALSIMAACFLVSMFFVFLVALGFELRASRLQGTSLFFVLGIFELGSPELFSLGWLQIVILLISAL
jgi:hypothetical protein